MKILRPLLLSFLVIFAVSSCKKESDDLRIVGDWEIRYYAGGLLPGAQFPDGNGQILRFSETTYQRLKNGAVIKSGTYQIVEEKFWAGDHRIIFDGDLNALPDYIKISKDNLTIFSGAPVSLDGLETVYERN